MNLRKQIDLIEQQKELHEKRREERKTIMYMRTYLRNALVTKDKMYFKNLKKHELEELKREMEYLEDLQERELQQLESIADPF